MTMQRAQFVYRGNPTAGSGDMKVDMKMINLRKREEGYSASAITCCAAPSELTLFHEAAWRGGVMRGVCYHAAPQETA